MIYHFKLAMNVKKQKHTLPDQKQPSAPSIHSVLPSVILAASGLWVVKQTTFQTWSFSMSQEQQAEGPVFLNIVNQGWPGAERPSRSSGLITSILVAAREGGFI